MFRKSDNWGVRRKIDFMNILSAVLDIFVVVSIVLITATSIKRGSIVAIIEFVGGIISAVVSAFSGWLIAITAYNLTFKGSLIRSLDSVVSNENGYVSKDLFNALPRFVQNALELVGINASNLLSVSGVNNTSTVTEAIEAQAAPYSILYMTKISMVIIFTLLIVVMITLSSKLSKHFVTTELKAANNIISFIFGLVKAVLIIMMLMILIDAIVLNLSADSAAAFNEAVNSSILFKLIHSVNIPLFIISIVTGV